MRRSLLAFALATLGLSACVVPAPTRDLGALSTQGTIASPDAVALISAQREAAGLGPVTPTRPLAEAARVQAAHQASIETMTHAGPKNGSLGDRLGTVGAPKCKSFENVAEGWRTPQQVVEAWMASPKHRTNILRSRGEHAAVAYADSASGTRYWTMVISTC